MKVKITLDDDEKKDIIERLTRYRRELRNILSSSILDSAFFDAIELEYPLCELICELN